MTMLRSSFLSMSDNEAGRSAVPEIWLRYVPVLRFWFPLREVSPFILAVMVRRLYLSVSSRVDSLR